jgi:hypothetical protein
MINVFIEILIEFNHIQFSSNLFQLNSFHNFVELNSIKL